MGRRNVTARLRGVRWVVTDVDGVLTDGTSYYSERGEALKRFNHRDGFAVHILRDRGVGVAFMSGDTAIIRARARKLGVRDVMLGVEDKGAELRRFASRKKIPLASIAFLGDDLNDLGALSIAGVAVAPADACPEARKLAHLVTKSKGGGGVLREFAELVKRARGR